MNLLNNQEKDLLQELVKTELLIVLNITENIVLNVSKEIVKLSVLENVLVILSGIWTSKNVKENVQLTMSDIAVELIILNVNQSLMETIVLLVLYLVKVQNMIPI